MKTLDPFILERAKSWLAEAYDPQTRAEVQRLIDHDPAALTEAFYQDLEFGTGGLRGIMGVGSNRMNKYTVASATQGFANYLLASFPDEEQLSVAIAHDCRINSEFFTAVAADVLTANGIKVFLFDGLRPTPVLSFAVRQFGCQGGIVITASHNPKEYNGYKVYWDDGGQLVSPHDKNVIAEVQKIASLDQIKFSRREELIELLDEDFDKLYIDTVKGYSLNPDVISANKDLKIVFTPIHGTAVHLVPAALKAYGFEKVYHVPEQDVISGEFPTVVSPNPEEPAALKMAIDRGKEVGADLIMATDPDGDRVGIVVKDTSGAYILLNGNQTAALLLHYILSQWKAKGKFRGNEFVVKTIVTTELLCKMADAFDVACYDVLTGFKYIAEIIRELEGSKQFIAGGEESYGYLVGDYVRDKDAVISCCMIAEAAAWARSHHKTLYETLLEIYTTYGMYYEKLLSITRQGKSGLEEIQAMLAGYRQSPPAIIDGSAVVRLIDYLTQTDKDLTTGTVKTISFPASNVIQLFTADGTKITMRPSGTEPKVKFYFGTCADISSPHDYVATRDRLDQKIARIMRELKLG